MPVTAHHTGTDKLGLAALLEACANDQWIGERPVFRHLHLITFQTGHDVA